MYRLPRRRFPRVNRIAVRLVARLHVVGSVGCAASVRNGLGVDPVELVDPMARDAPALDGRAARLRTVGPVVGLPHVRARLVGQAGPLAARPAVRGAALLVRAHFSPPPLSVSRLNAVHLTVLVSLTARLRTLSIRSIRTKGKFRKNKNKNRSLTETKKGKTIEIV